MTASVGSVRTADCSDWKRGTVAQRRSTVVAAPQVCGRSGRVLGGNPERDPCWTTTRAYRVLQSYCTNYFARGFKLYKLYERAAAFVGH